MCRRVQNMPFLAFSHHVTDKSAGSIAFSHRYGEVNEGPRVDWPVNGLAERYAYTCKDMTLTTSIQPYP